MRIVTESTQQFCTKFEKFHTYVYGRSDITVETDHKPLVKLKKKALFQMTPRQQKMFMKLRQYTFTLVHKPGKDILIADYMSRLYPKGEDTDSGDQTETRAYLASF